MSEMLPTRAGDPFATSPGTEPTAARREHWRSLGQLADSPEVRRFAEAEFPAVFEGVTDPFSRRKFLGLMGATLALTGLAGCSRPLALILPYSKMPEEVLPGVPQYYATVMPFRGVGEGILVRSNEGRPQKVDGNPEHPSSLGASHVFAQASILQLFDPDRSAYPTEGDTRRSWDDFAAWSREHFRALRSTGGRGLRFLAGSDASPALAALRAEIAAAFPSSAWHTYEPLNRDEAIEGSRIAFGRPLRAQLALDQADVVAALDCDFLTSEPNSVRHARDFASRRRVTSEHDSMNRLYAVESAFSLTGAMADHRLRATHEATPGIALALAGELASAHGIAVAGAEGAAAARGSLEPEALRFVAALAKDLAAHRGRSVVTAGSGQPARVHALVHAMNQALGNVGPVVRMTEEPEAPAQTASITDLSRALDAGEVDTLVILGGNPAYDAPADLGFAEKIGKARHTVRLGLYADETSQACRWHLPQAHFLEAWGDARAWDGTRSIQQPLIAPLHEGKSEIELLALLLERPRLEGHGILHELTAREWGALEADARWRKALSDGVIPGTAYAEVLAPVDGGAVRAAWSGTGAVESTGALEVTFHPDRSTWDGRFANSGWLQELPDAMTKLTWDNAACVSPATARTLGVENGDLLRITVGSASLTIPAWVMPGQADGSIALSLGYGRRRAGRVGDGVGFDTYALRGTAAMAAAGASVARAGGRHELVTTQEHQVMEGRPLVREATLEEYRKEPEFAPEMVEHPPLESMYTEREYDFTKGYQWGMSIDLNTCIGCNACMVGCQSENNIAIVGKDQVKRGREMHWIRVDRYFAGSPEAPEAVHQPVPCMQCENAPCESVCPVQATAHSDEGLNDMTYNRCIGTRYCNNNCPYKVRHFNFFDWNKDLTDLEKMAKNPDVTVRMRGIMEKCTYCVQRINRARITAKNEDRPIRDGEVRTACQDACPTESIIFGNINDPESRVSRLKAQNRDYAMLAEINTKPRTTYLAKIRNPNPELEQA